MEKSMLLMGATLAKVTPKGILVGELAKVTEKYMEAYVSDKSEKELDDLFNKLGPPCLMILLKSTMENQNPLDLLKSIEELERAQDLIKPSKG